MPHPKPKPSPTVVAREGFNSALGIASIPVDLASAAIVDALADRSYLRARGAQALKAADDAATTALTPLAGIGGIGGDIDGSRAGEAVTVVLDALAEGGHLTPKALERLHEGTHTTPGEIDA